MSGVLKPDMRRAKAQRTGINFTPKTILMFYLCKERNGRRGLTSKEVLTIKTVLCSKSQK